jgi:hypothetical protein
MKPKQLCVLALAMACGVAYAGEPVDMARVAVQSDRTTILGPADGAGHYRITAVEKVMLENWPHPIPPGGELYEGDIILSGTAENVGPTEIWVLGADGDEYGVLPGAMMAPGCMTRCSWSGCPEGMGANCRAVMQGDRNCCVCECKAGAYPESCSCSVTNPA